MHVWKLRKPDFKKSTQHVCLSLIQENVAFIQDLIYQQHNQLLQAMNRWQ